MSEEGKQWVGQLVNGKFPLQQFLGGSAHSAVFLTERTEDPKKAAIKLVRTAPDDTERQLFQWRVAAKLPHPHLLRIFETGQCELGGRSLLYVVTEYAEENLAEVLAQRVLTTNEARDLLKPLLDALAYLHGKGFVHGDLRPTNILASADQLKLSTDSISAAGIVVPRRTGSHAAPELRQGQASTATDFWSLGAVLVEGLTGKAPSWDSSREPTIPKELPEPFADIARHCLRLEPQARWTMAEIKNRLDPNTVPHPPRRAVPVRTQTSSKWLYVVPSFVLILALVIMLWPRAEKTGAKAVSEVKKQTALKPNPTVPSKPVAGTGPTKVPASQSQQTPGTVLNRVVPQVPQKALDTITGRVRVAVRANVDESGNVVSTTLEHSGPSKYFARLALQAAENWKFQAPQTNSGPQPSTWIVHFTFTSAGVDGSATPAR